MVTKRKRTPAPNTETEDDNIEAEIGRIRKALEAFEEADPVKKSIAEDKDGTWQALRLANKAADEALKKAQDECDEAAIQKAWGMTKKARQDIINAEFRARTAGRKASHQEKKKVEDASALKLNAEATKPRVEPAEFKNEDAELEADPEEFITYKEMKKKTKAKSAAKKQAANIAELNELYNASIAKEQPQTPFPEKTELIMWRNFNKRQGTDRKRNKVEWDIWTTWMQCRLCGSRRCDEDQLRRHWQLDHQFGGMRTEKRKKIKAELQPFLQNIDYRSAPLLAIKHEEHEVQSFHQGALDTNCRSPPPLTITPNESCTGFVCGLPSNEDHGKTCEEATHTANKSFPPPVNNETVAQNNTRNYINYINTNFSFCSAAPFMIKQEGPYNDFAPGTLRSAGPKQTSEDSIHTAHNPFISSAAYEMNAPTAPNNYSHSTFSSYSALPLMIKQEEPYNTANDPFFLASADNMEAPTVPHNYPTSLEDSMRQQSSLSLAEIMREQRQG